MGHPEILDWVPDSSGSKDLTGQSSDDAQHLCVNLAFHRGVLRCWGTDCTDLEHPPALGRRESDWWKILFLGFILRETSCHRRNRRMPLDTSSTELFSAWEQMLTPLVSAPCSLMLWVLLLKGLRQRWFMAPGRFWGTLHVTSSSPLQRDRLGCEERCSSKVMWTFKSELKNIPCLGIFSVDEQLDSQAYRTGLWVQ